MIKYSGGLYGFQALFRLHGSAAFKALPPALVSTAFYLILFNVQDLDELEPPLFAHPYPLAALMVAFTFLLTFKASFSYNRYWEAMTAVHQMHSKWLDVGMELAAFHLQSKRYVKPPAFGDHPQVKSLQRERMRNNEPTREELEETLDAAVDSDNSNNLRRRSRFQRAWRKIKKSRRQRRPSRGSEHQEAVLSFRSDRVTAKSINAVPKSKHHSPKSFPVETLYDSNINSNNLESDGGDGTTTAATSRRQPPLFLQESAHLLSLLSAVAMSTLRGDLEEAESPLTTFRAGQPWPHVDPDDYSADIRKDWYKSRHRSWTVLNYLLGRSRNARAQTLYNAARPFRVIGGVSDAEVELLQAARGPLAKVALCTFWLQEFISREHLAGSTGGVAHPIISRLYQFTSDGMIGYNQARKVAMIPFPFAHAQITALFIGVVIFLLPLLMITYVNQEVFGALLNLLTVMCFTGLHEVSRELEDPFQNVPNDVPLNNFQAQFNEALMTMFSGYHPDAFWKVCVVTTIPAATEESSPLEKPKNRRTNSAFELLSNLVDRVRDKPGENKKDESAPLIAVGETHLAVVSRAATSSTTSSKKNGHRRDTSKASSVIVAEIPLDELDEHLSVQTGEASNLSMAYEMRRRISSIENMELHAPHDSSPFDDEDNLWLHHPFERETPGDASPKDAPSIPTLGAEGENDSLDDKAIFMDHVKAPAALPEDDSFRNVHQLASITEGVRAHDGLPDQSSSERSLDAAEDEDEEDVVEH